MDMWKGIQAKGQGFRMQVKVTEWGEHRDLWNSTDINKTLRAESKWMTYWKNLKALTMAPELENSILRSSSTTEGLKTQTDQI